jgi:CubicO group peptidase (beta-lactamase class C family)
VSGAAALGLLWTGRGKVLKWLRLVSADRPTGRGVLSSSATLVVGMLLGGCIGEPEPTAATAPASSSLRELQAVLEQYSDEWLQEGAPAVLIEAKVRHEEWSHAVGVRSLDGGVPAQLVDPMQGGGITQSMVAVSVLKLVDEGRLALDEPTTRYVPAARTMWLWGCWWSDSAVCLSLTSCGPTFWNRWVFAPLR